MIFDSLPPTKFLPRMNGGGILWKNHHENGLFYATVNDFTHGLYVISQCDFFDAVARLSTAGVGPVTIHPPWAAKNVV